MNELIDFLKPFVLYLFFGFIGLLILYVRTFIQESAKINALKRKNKELVEETESIKKDHQLDISKRRYQYESKKEQYLGFFKLLDNFTNEATLKNQSELMPILDEFNKNYLNAATQGNKKKENLAVTVMSKKIQKMTFDSYAELTKLKQETNTIRLIASDEILDKLNLLELSYDKLMEQSDKMMSDLPKLMLTGNQVRIELQQKELELKGKVTQSIKDDIIKLMRKELNEI
ncbi:hypothetical protein MG290_11910 [Flavobacterium sp. CBA20B-1]|uniref:hypothetical protein n=1 Tax=unclassified Flavobacterium TaxID=196869 RepID=UPI0022250BA2|nr:MULTISPECIES: hypothetical protein [unclassified Flavobacterium]WCM41645.1 hypothetical protein MG290_11910 [Flavobacterium sp. CBA20B-1]